VREAMRAATMGAQANGPGSVAAPVIPFAWQYYLGVPPGMNSSHLISVSELQSSLTIPYKLGATGVAIWFDEEVNAPSGGSARYPGNVTSYYLTNTAPLAKSLLATAASCSAARCAGHGRCAKATNRSCVCYPGWAGATCSTRGLKSDDTLPDSAAAALLPIPTTVTTAADASLPELHAAAELTKLLNSILNHANSQSHGSPVFTLATATASLASRLQIAVGHGAALALGVPASALATKKLGLEGFLASTAGVPAGSVVLSGAKGAPRGALYAVNAFAEALGVHYLALDTTVLPSTLPALPTLNPESKPFVPALEMRYIGELSFRAVHGKANASADLNVHLGLNTGLDEVHGGSKTTSAGGTAFTADFVPPKIYNSSKNQTNYHPQWFTGGQLCWKAPGLQEFLAERVIELCRQPKYKDIAVVSIEMNDNADYCKSGDDLVQEKAEGDTPMGPLLQTLNFVADAIKDEFPHVKLNTLAYPSAVYTAPKITRPRKNVIIQVAPILANFGAPFSDKSNAVFQEQMDKWHKICTGPIHIWNYQTNFGSYITPFPNTLVAGPNVKWLHSKGVTGIYEEGNAAGPGGDLVELRNYVSSKMMWNPQNDPQQLITTFLRGFYGEKAVPHMQEYITTVHVSSMAMKRPTYGVFYDGIIAPFLTADVVLRSATALSAARRVATGLHAEHVNRSTIAIWYVALWRYQELTDHALAHSIAWPMEPTMEESFESLATAVALAEASYGKKIMLAEPNHELNMTLLHTMLFHECSTGWKRAARQTQAAPCLPVCSSGSLGKRLLPSNAAASTIFDASRGHVCGNWTADGEEPNCTVSLEGQWTAAANPPQWIELSLDSPGSTMHLTAVEATVSDRYHLPIYTGAARPGHSNRGNHSLFVNGKLVSVWSGVYQTADTLTWKTETPIAATSVKIITSYSPVWVTWAGIKLYSCPTAAALKSDDPLTQVPIDISGRKQLLVDNMLLASVRGASFKSWVPQKRSMGTRPLIAPDSPWEKEAGMFMTLYDSVLPRDSTPDGAPGDFQVWYWALSHKLDSKRHPELSEQNGVTGYAEISADLSNVTKPLLHQHRWMNGTAANNYLAGLSDGWQGSQGAREGCSVWKDPKRSLGGLYVSQAKLAAGSKYGLALSTSEDGVTDWKDVVRLENGPFDTQTVGLFDEDHSQYALFTRGCTHDTAAEKVLGYRCVRKLSTCPGMFHSSTGLKSLETCRNESIAMQTDALDNATHMPEDDTCTPAHDGHAAKCNMPTLDYYGGLVWQYEGVYWMFPQRTWHWSARKYPHSGNGTPVEPEPNM
jgi:hypothetical protein